MKIAHLSDLHFGARNLDEAERCFGSAVEEAVRRGIECAALTGDASDHALEAHAPAYEALVRGVRRLAEHCPVIVLQGTYSHEPPGTLNVFRHIGGRYPVFVADRIGHVALREDGTWFAAEEVYFDGPPARTKALFSCLPTVNKAVVAGWTDAGDVHLESANAVARVLRGFAPGNERARALGVPTIGLAHGTVNGCVTEHDVQMAGLDHEFSTAVLFDAAASAFMLGHIHRHQSWSSGRRSIAYAGSIGRFHFGEEGEKGWLLWDVDAAGAAFQFVRTPARRMVAIEFDGAPDMAQLRAMAPALAGACVRVRWAVAEEARNSVDREAILDILRGAEAVKIEARVVPAVRTRAAGIGSCRTLEQKLRRWAESASVAAEPLLERLQTLRTAAPEDIAAAMLGDNGDARCAASEAQARFVPFDSEANARALSAQN